MLHVTCDFFLMPVVCKLVLICMNIVEDIVELLADLSMSYRLRRRRQLMLIMFDMVGAWDT